MRINLGLTSPLLLPSVQAKRMVERQQKVFTYGWDQLFIGYSAAAYFHSSQIKINSWTDALRVMRGSMLPRRGVRELKVVLERAGLENMDLTYRDGRVVVEEGHLGLKAEMVCSTRKHLRPYGLEKVELPYTYLSKNIRS